MWAALPPAVPEEQLIGEALLDALRAHQVAALYLQPEHYAFNLSAWCLDALLEPLAAARVPVFIDYRDLATGQAETIPIGKRWWPSAADGRRCR